MNCERDVLLILMINNLCLKKMAVVRGRRLGEISFGYCIITWSVFCYPGIGPPFCLFFAQLHHLLLVFLIVLGLISTNSMIHTDFFLKDR